MQKIRIGELVAITLAVRGIPCTLPRKSETLPVSDSSNPSSSLAEPCWVHKNSVIIGQIVDQKLVQGRNLLVREWAILASDEILFLRDDYDNPHDLQMTPLTTEMVDWITENCRWDTRLGHLKARATSPIPWLKELQ